MDFGIKYVTFLIILVSLILEERLISHIQNTEIIKNTKERLSVMLNLLNIENKVIVYILAIVLIIVSVICVYNINKSKRLQSQVTSLQIVNQANILAISSLNKVLSTTNTVISEWSESDSIISDGQREFKDEIKKEMLSNETSKSWGDELVPDTFNIMLKRNSN